MLVSPVSLVATLDLSQAAVDTSKNFFDISLHNGFSAQLVWANVAGVNGSLQLYGKNGAANQVWTPITGYSYPIGSASSNGSDMIDYDGANFQHLMVGWAQANAGGTGMATIYFHAKPK